MKHFRNQSVIINHEDDPLNKYLEERESTEECELECTCCGSKEIDDTLGKVTCLDCGNIFYL